MRQIISSGAEDNPSASTTEYCPIVCGNMGGTDAWATSTGGRTQVVPTDGTFSNLKIYLEVAPGTGNSRTITLYKNGVATSLSVAITNSDTTGEDTSNTVSVSAGDILYLEHVPNSGPAASAVKWSIEFEGTAGNESILMSNVAGGLEPSTPVADRVTNLAGFSSNTQPYSYAYRIKQIIPTNGTIKKLYMWMEDSPGSGDSITATLYVNDEATDLSLTISNPDQTGNDTSNEVSVSAGDSVYLYLEPTDVILDSGAFGVVFVPTTAGESICLGGTNDVPSTASAQYATPFIANGGDWDTEDDAIARGGQTKIKKLYVELYEAPGSGKSYTFTLRKNGADTDLTTTISDSNTTGNDTTHEIEISDGDLISLKCTPSGSPTQTYIRFGFVSYISTGAETYNRQHNDTLNISDTVLNRILKNLNIKNLNEFTQIIRPASDVYNQLSVNGGTYGWEVLDESSTNDSDYIYTSTDTKYCVCNGENKNVPASATITKVVLTVRVKRTGGPTQTALRGIGDNSSWAGLSFSLSEESFYDETFEYTENPSSGTSWTVDDVNHLTMVIGSNSIDDEFQCSQMYATVYYTDIPGYNLTDSFILSKVKNAFIEEGINVSDSFIKEIIYNRLIEDNASLSDVFSKLITTTKQKQEATTLYDLLIKGVSKNPFGESLSTSDSFSYSKTMNINLVDSLSSSDSFEKTINIHFLFSESLNAGDESIKQTNIIKTLGEAEALYDSLYFRLNIIRNLLESVSTSDDFEIDYSLTKNLSETISLIDLFNRKINYIRNFIEIASLNDEEINKIFLTKNLNELASLTDFISYKLNVIKSSSENINLVDTLEKIFNKTISFQEEQILSDSIFNQINYLRVLNEGISITDFIRNKISATTNLSDHLNVIDYFSRDNQFFKILSEEITTNDSLSLKILAGVEYEEEQLLYDSFSYSLIIPGTYEETISISDNLTNKVTCSKIFIENLTFSDYFLKTLIMNKTFEETFVITDSINKGISKIFSEITLIQDSLSTRKTYLRTFSEIINTIDNSKKGIYINFIENLNILDYNYNSNSFAEKILLVDSFIKEIAKAAKRQVKLYGGLLAKKRKIK